MNNIIIAEANFIEQMLHELYVGRIEFTPVNYRSMRERLQTIRDEARKNSSFNSTNLSSLTPNK